MTVIVQTLFLAHIPHCTMTCNLRLLLPNWINSMLSRPLKMARRRPLEIDCRRPLEMMSRRPLEMARIRPFEIDNSRPLEKRSYKTIINGE